MDVRARHLPFSEANSYYTFLGESLNSLPHYFRYCCLSNIEACGHSLDHIPCFNFPPQPLLLYEEFVDHRHILRECPVHPSHTADSLVFCGHVQHSTLQL